MKPETMEKYISTQFSQITRLQEQIASLQEENRSLRELLKTAVPLTKQEIQENLTTEEEIAEREIKKLNELSQKESLTFDEAKKLIAYVGILETRRKNKVEKSNASGMSDEELMKKLNG